MPSANTSFGPGGIAQSVLEREPVAMPRPGDFFGDLEKFRRVFSGARQPVRRSAAADPLTPKFGKNLVPLPTTEPRSGGGQARSLRSSRVAAQDLAPIAFKMRGGPNTVAGYTEVAFGSPGSVFAGYRDRRDTPGPTTFANQPSNLIGGSLSAISGLGGVGGGRAAAARPIDDDDERADFFGTGTTNRRLQLATLLGNAAQRDKEMFGG